MTAPFFTDTDGPHPVSGNRAFGIKQNTDGAYTIYTRGVDRVRYRSLEWLANTFMGGAFAAADDLWTTFQNNLVNFIQNNGGSAQKIAVQPKRVDIEAVHDFIFGGN